MSCFCRTNRSLWRPLQAFAGRCLNYLCYGGKVHRMVLANNLVSLIFYDIERSVNHKNGLLHSIRYWIAYCPLLFPCGLIAVDMCEFSMRQDKTRQDKTRQDSRVRSVQWNTHTCACTGLGIAFVNANPLILILQLPQTRLMASCRHSS